MLQNIPQKDEALLSCLKVFIGIPQICLTRSQTRVGERGLLEKGSFQKNPSSRDFREFRDSRDSKESQTVENERKSDHFLEILDNSEILEILEIPPVKRPLS